VRIEIGRRHYLAYLLLPHHVKLALLSPESRSRLDGINRAFNERIYSGPGASEYDRTHRYLEAGQHDHPVRELVDVRWVGNGYGRALELGAGSGYFTTMIAAHAEQVFAVEPVPDMQRVLTERCDQARLDNVRVVGATAFDLADHVGEASVDSAFILQSLHHFHRRDEVFRALGRVVRPGGRLFVVEPHHNLRRVARLLRTYVTHYRAPAFWRDERNWATHDFLTRAELRALCRQGGFTDIHMEGYWIPFFRRLFPDVRQRFGWEHVAGRIPGLRHVAAVLALTARRRADGRSASGSGPSPS
jgi:ubiquinone/menaquinone biosynthesis C-methylase UbiE